MTDFPKELKPGPLEAIGLWKASRYLRRAKEILMADLKDQPTAMPTRKVVAAGGGSVTAALIVWAAAKFFGFEMGPEDAALFAAALGILSGYFVRERATA